jgi:hypothetical protein
MGHLSWASSFKEPQAERLSKFQKILEIRSSSPKEIFCEVEVGFQAEGNASRNTL